MDKFESELVRRSSETLGMAVYTLQEGSAANGSGMSNATAKAFINGLLFAESKSIRTSTLILAAFNIIAALATASSILYDCYWASRRNAPAYKRTKTSFLDIIHPAETFSLILAIGIIIQGCVFAASQGTGLQGLFVKGCATTAQFMLPAIFLVPFIQVVFGAECAFRSLRSSPLPARGKWDVPVLLGVITLMEIGVWIPTHIDPEMDRCFASLAWFVEHFGRLSLILLSITGGLTILFAIIIFYRLTTVTSIGQCQRIAASRMVYYLVLAVVSLAFVMPWFVTLTMKRPNIITSMMATVVLNLTGLMTGLLQLFLRSNATTTSFRPRGLPGWGDEKGKQQIRLWGPNDLSFGGHMMVPVSGPRSPNTIGSRSSLVGAEKDRAMSMESIRSPPFISATTFNQNIKTSATLPTLPEPTIRSPARGHAHKQSYSIFPSESIASPIRTATANSIPQVLLPSSIFSTAKHQPTAAPSTTTRVKDAMSGILFSRRDLDSMYSTNETLAPPQPIFSSRGHRRDSSMASSATVQIGLRLSNMLGPIQDEPQFPTPPLRRPNSPSLQLQTRNLNTSSSLNQQSTPGASPEMIKSPPLSKAERDARMKTLPPVPRVDSARVNSVVVVKEGEKGLQLSPTVYSPLESRKYSPTVKAATGKGAVLRGSPTAASASSSSPLSLAPPSLAGKGKGSERASKLDWI